MRSGHVLKGFHTNAAIYVAGSAAADGISHRPAGVAFHRRRGLRHSGLRPFGDENHGGADAHRSRLHLWVFP